MVRFVRSSTSAITSALDAEPRLPQQGENGGGDDQYELPKGDDYYMHEGDEGSAVVFVGRANSTSELEGNSSSSVFGTYYERGCQFSNDPGYGEENGENQVPYLPVCNLTSYQCPPESNATTATFPLEISFDYELHYNPNSNLINLLRYYEELSLDHLATEMELRNCNSSAASNFTTTRRGRGLLLGASAFPEDVRAMVEGIDLFPRDWPDQDNTNCLVLVDESLHTGVACVPVLGALTVHAKPNGSGTDNGNRTGLSEPEADRLRSSVLAEIKRGMDEDLYLTRMSIYKMVYVGDRHELEASIADSEAASGGSSLPAWTIAVIVALAAIAMLVFGLLIARKWRQKQRLRGDSRRGTDDEESTVAPGGEPGAAPVRRSLAVRDSLALKPQGRWPSGWWPPKSSSGGDDCAATDETTHSSGSPNFLSAGSISPDRVLMSTSGGESPLRPPSQFFSRRSMASFESSVFGVYTMGSDLTNPEEQSRASPQQPGSTMILSSGSGAAGPPQYIEPYLGSAGGSSSWNGDESADIPDSGSERSARRTLQMT
jgi:hypothetical protein